MVRRSPASANPVAFTRKSILPKPPQSAILILVAWTWGDWNWRKLTLWSGVEKGKTRRWVGRGVIWDVPQLSILWESVRNMLKTKSSRAFYLSKRCTSKRILTIYKGFAENKYYKLFRHPTIFITPTSPSTSRRWFKVPQTNIPLVVLKSSQIWFWRCHVYLTRPSNGSSSAGHRHEFLSIPMAWNLRTVPLRVHLASFYEL